MQPAPQCHEKQLIDALERIVSWREPLVAVYPALGGLVGAIDHAIGLLAKIEKEKT